MIITQLQQQRAAGFRRLRFDAGLEQHYRAERDHGLRERSRPVSASALALFLLYTLLDVIMLPPELARQTMAVRVFFTCPVIALVWWLSYHRVPLTTFVRCYVLAYIAGGVSVVAIIALARLQPYPMPYDGILLMVMFGYVVMGMPFRTASLASALIILMYLIMELGVGTEPAQLTINGFFIVTANITGMVGSWLSEYRQRSHFLDRQLLDASRREAEQDSARQTHLITVASHDLRQPLNVISLMLENLSGEGLPVPQSRLVAKLKTSVVHFNGLLASVLDISRIREGMVTPELKPLDAGLALQQLIDTCLDDATDRQITLTLSPVAPHIGVVADPQLLHRVLQNLVFNGLQHSGAKGVVIRARPLGKQVRFEVLDDGQGLDEATLTQVFDAFFRADVNNHLQPPGLGLGLAIVKELTELMDGTCGVNSEPGQGSCFWVSFPASGQLAADIGAPAVLSGARSDRCQLVVVEDHDDARHWLCETLRSWGYTASAFATAEQALTEDRPSKANILISDLHLPGMSGQALFQRLFSDQVLRGGILMTADTSLPQGFDYKQRLWVLHKPLSPMRLRAAILQLTRSTDCLEETDLS
ncbi:hybrid sensor histidine kinase/response regulator [Marinobacter caseinilyticus]|uniref:hybrid sensor histidine kinase/response regulator n=1 Tax=Marinobacter caseinilyticus TaxID=2692195 RepID=UPI00140B57A5|nr:hybrid sensor histidine kinase/response regulator [Marinobacter caseinilyticus]